MRSASVASRVPCVSRRMRRCTNSCSRRRKLLLDSMAPGGRPSVAAMACCSSPSVKASGRSATTAGRPSSGSCVNGSWLSAPSRASSPTIRCANGSAASAPRTEASTCRAKAWSSSSMPISRSAASGSSRSMWRCPLACSRSRTAAHTGIARRLRPIMRGSRGCTREASSALGTSSARSMGIHRPGSLELNRPAARAVTGIGRTRITSNRSLPGGSANRTGTIRVSIGTMPMGRSSSA